MKQRQHNDDHRWKHSGTVSVAPPVAPDLPAAVNESAALTVDRRGAGMGVEFRSTVTITGPDGIATVHRTEWLAKRPWLMAHELLKRKWTNWVVGGV